MAVTFKPADSIFNKPYGESDISAKSKELSIEQTNLTRPEKYDTRAELDKSGLGAIHDQAQALGLNSLVNKTTVNISASNLGNEKQVWQDINDIMVKKFEVSMVKSSIAAGTNAEKADRALSDIARILRRQNADGAYIFGGNNPNDDPLSIYNGEERVAIDLNNISNNMNGVFVNNFSEANVNETELTISSKHEIKQSFLYGGMDAIVKTIGYLNMVKEGTADIKDIAAAQKSQLHARGEVSILIGLELEKTKAARVTNDNDIKDSYNILKIFQKDITEQAGRVGDLMKSLLAMISIKSVTNKIFDALIHGFKQ